MFFLEVDIGFLFYLRKYNIGEEYLFVILIIVMVVLYIIYENEFVMVMGGFNGIDLILIVIELKKLVKEGKVKYFFLLRNNFGNSEFVFWIKKNGKEILFDEYSSFFSSLNSS